MAKFIIFTGILFLFSTTATANFAVVAVALLTSLRNGQFKRHLCKLIHRPDDLDGYAPFCGRGFGGVRIAVARVRAG